MCGAPGGEGTRSVLLHIIIIVIIIIVISIFIIIITLASRA